MRLLLATLLFAGLMAAQPMPAPLPQIVPPQSESILETARRMQRIRQIQLQNRQIELENAQMQREIQLQRPQSALREQDLVTGGLLNCRAWGLANETTQLAYVAGLNEASIMLLAEFSKMDDVQRVVPIGANNAEARTAIASYCAAPENRPVPVAFIYRVVAAKANGATTDAIEGQLAAYRKIAANTFQPEK